MTETNFVPEDDRIPLDRKTLDNAMPDDDVKAFDTASRAINSARSELNQVILGHPDVTDQLLTCVLAGGHALLVGPPGTGKTRLVGACAHILGLATNRVQFTPDLMPADILGAEILDISEDGERSFRFIEGPIFTQLLMADEINRASPRTQSALLQAMQERYVTIAGQNRDLPAPFHVLATQNPLDQEGTYPLPEAQLDRFLMQIDIGYPDRDSEREILTLTTQTADIIPKTVLSIDELSAAQLLVRRMPVGRELVDAILEITHQARPQTPERTGVSKKTGTTEKAGARVKPGIMAKAGVTARKDTNAPDLDSTAPIGSFLARGAGPRASQALSLGIRALALIDGRYSPSFDDLKKLAPPVLRHRLSPNFKARSADKSVEDLIHAVLEQI